MATVLEDKPKTKVSNTAKRIASEPTYVTAKLNEAEEKLPKYALLYFGDNVSKNTLIRYLNGKVMFTEGAIKDPSKQLVVFVNMSKSNADNDKVTNGLNQIISTFGNGANITITPIDTGAADQSEAYFYAVANSLSKILQAMGETIQFLVLPHDSSVHIAANQLLNFGQIETQVENYNADHKLKDPVRVIYENMHRDLTSENGVLLQTIYDAVEEGKTDFIQSLVDTNIPIDTNVIKLPKIRNRLQLYLAEKEKDVPINIKTKVKLNGQQEQQEINILSYKIEQVG